VRRAFAGDGKLSGATDGFRRGALVAAPGVLLGWAVVRGRPWTELAAVLVMLFVAAVMTPHRWITRLRHGGLLIELPVLLLLFDVYYSRPRSAQSLAENPLDATGLIKVAAVAVALVIGCVAYATCRTPTRPFPAAFRLFGLYAAAVFLGISASVDPRLTAYRGLELAAGVAVVSAAYRRYGREAVKRIERLLYGATAVLLVLVWLDVLLVPSRALANASASPLRWQIQGVYPPIASNGVGTLGLVLALWSLARLLARSAGDRINRTATALLAALGVATLVAAQYRTGYVAFAFGLAVLLAVRGRALLAVAAVGAAAVFAFSSAGSVVGRSEPFLLRGQTTAQAAQLSGRFYLWHHALPFWRASPVFGRGLLTSTRLEVLPSIGYPDTATIHGTWIEALVGTGVVGTALLAASLLVLLQRALSVALRDGRVIPVVLVVAMLVRSTTGSSVESLGLGALLLLVLALDTQAEPEATVAEPEATVAEPKWASA